MDKKVIVSAPCKNADKTIVYNENTLKKNDKIISAASCTLIVCACSNVLNNIIK